MKSSFGLTYYFPLLKKFFLVVFPKVLDFTKFGEVQGNVNLLIEERNILLKYIENKNQADEWNLGLIQTLARNYVQGVALERIGSKHDGGYLIPTHFTKNSFWVTIGLGENFDFENHLAENGCIVNTFDHTVPRRPRKLSERINFFKLGWGSLLESQESEDILVLESLTDFANMHHSKKVDWCLKFDIEGNEWKCIDQIVNLVNKPSIISCELHGIIWGSSRYEYFEVGPILRLLMDEYVVCHIHGNNYSPYFHNREYGIYDVVELTLIHKKVTSRLNLNNTNHLLQPDVRNNQMSEQMPFGYLNQTTS